MASPKTLFFYSNSGILPVKNASYLHNGAKIKKSEGMCRTGITYTTFVPLNVFNEVPLFADFFLTF